MRQGALAHERVAAISTLNMERSVKRTLASAVLLTLVATWMVVPRQAPAAASPGSPNVVILMTDDQRWDKVTPQYMPNVYDAFVQHGYPFSNSFVPNPLCCPSRTSTLTGNYSHTTGVWSNGKRDPRYGGFFAFHDKHTMATDFQLAGYRTAMIGKYLNGYAAGKKRYIPPGWDRWFATNSGAYYKYGVTSNHRLIKYGSTNKDYSTRVLEDHAETFVTNAVEDQQPFFLYYSFAAPHGPAIPDTRDTSRFAGETDTNFHDDMLESAYGVDRAVGQLLPLLPSNTIVVYLSDNGYLWNDAKGDRGSLNGKQWSYNESIRVPIFFKSMDGSIIPSAAPEDMVLNIDLRNSLEFAAGITPVTSSEGLNWFATDYSARSSFPLEHYSDGDGGDGGSHGHIHAPTYCGERERGWMYVRFKNPNGTYVEELYDDESERVNLVSDPTFADDLDRLRQESEAQCNPAPPGYSWSA